MYPHIYIYSYLSIYLSYLILSSLLISSLSISIPISISIFISISKSKLLYPCIRKIYVINRERYYIYIIIYIYTYNTFCIFLVWILQCFQLMTAMLPHYPLLQPQDIQDICPHPHKPSQRRIQLLHAPCLTESCYEAHQCLALPRRNFQWKMRLAWAGKYRKTCRNIWDMNGRFWEALGGTWEDIENLTACGKCVDNRKKIMKRHAIILYSPKRDK